MYVFNGNSNITELAMYDGYYVYYSVLGTLVIYINYIPKHYTYYLFIFFFSTVTIKNTLCIYFDV